MKAMKAAKAAAPPKAMKGDWGEGLFSIKCPLCCFNYLCGSCSLAHINSKAQGLSFLNKNLYACLFAQCIPMGGPIMLLTNGLAKADKDKTAVAILKCWCCGICYLHQQYKENGCPEAPGELITGACKQEEMK